MRDRLDKLIDRLDALSAKYQHLVIDDVDPTESGSKYAKDEVIRSTISFTVNWREDQLKCEQP